MRSKHIGLKASALIIFIALLGWIFSGVSGCDDGCSGLQVVQRGGTSVCDPAGVRVFFSVTDCDERPIADLSGENFEVINNETGTPFQSEGGSSSFMQALNFEFYTIMVIDLSYSIVKNDRLNDVIDGAKSFVKAMIEDQPADEFKHHIGIYVFGSTDESELLLSFTQDTADLYAALEGLRDEEGRGSTNLYGAYIAGIETLNGVKNTYLDRLVARSLVILTDGTHETGDEGQMRSDALDMLKTNEINAYSLGIKGDYNEDRLRELASHPDNFFLVDQASDLVSAFGDLAEQVEDWSRSHYVMGVCSPLEGSDRVMTIKVTQGDLSGSMKIVYDATGFNLTGCDATDIAEGTNCGQMGGE